MKNELWVISMVFIFMTAGSALADDWRIFGAQGVVQIAPKGGEPVTISNEKSPMMKVSEGSTITVKGKGKVVLVSLKSRQAFEIGDNSTALVDPASIKAIKGTVNPKSGFAPPTGKDGKMGGIVMRSISKKNRSCLKALSPVSTTVLETTQELRWDNQCDGLSKVTLTILSDEQVIHSAEVLSSSSYNLPKDILKTGNRYLWMIDGGASFDMASGVFLVAGGNEREEVLQRMKEISQLAIPEERLAYIYFLSDRGFSDMAKEEVERLRSAYPEAPGLSELP